MTSHVLTIVNIGTDFLGTVATRYYLMVTQKE